jgi:xylulokinase
MSVSLSAASALSWAARLCGCRDEAELLQQAAQLQPAQRERAPLFVPYLAGERTPHNNPLASASLSGLRHEHAAADIGYAVLEGVGFALRDGLAAMCGPAPPQALSLVGGGARSDLWASLLATILSCGLLRQDGVQAAALGAARLGWLAIGGDEAQVCRASDGARLFEPDARAATMLEPRYQRFRALYPALAVHDHDSTGAA